MASIGKVEKPFLRLQWNNNNKGGNNETTGPWRMYGVNTTSRYYMGGYKF